MPPTPPARQFGDRVDSVRVTVQSRGAHTSNTISFRVLGKTFTEVVSTVEDALAEAFGGSDPDEHTPSATPAKIRKVRHGR